MIITRPFREVMVTWFVGQSILVIALAFLLGLLTGRLGARRSGKVVRHIFATSVEWPDPAGNAAPQNAAPAPAGRPESGLATAGRPESGPTTAGRPESGPIPASRPETGPTPVGRPESGPTPVGRPESGPTAGGRLGSGPTATGRLESGPRRRPSPRPVPTGDDSGAGTDTVP
ncbi:hypothetical protein GCM10010168_49230 [Actinoplanes ianthinogenes]|uniref:Uncharacterized protein n=1 Tax=Actinoplanes ianthinogenes TaxID=122358 RepID=A0ABN6CLS1_9ACTN|nr:hypothetical protein [Actinoplanes ianthinogenes]BCJ45975.1 hypothetical protein Aiant_66320 [Actinoplanes ianthinogenes]GGR25478.1 hypothetical protein GCM10010168_49230 [Actinoplanes ianthinogenes]